MSGSAETNGTLSIDAIAGDILNWSVRIGAKDENSDDTQISYEYRCTQLKNEQPLTENRTVGRNDQCPCESGKKYKECCMH